jgi:hypothetical protein
MLKLSSTVRSTKYEPSTAVRFNDEHSNEREKVPQLQPGGGTHTALAGQMGSTLFMVRRAWRNKGDVAIHLPVAARKANVNNDEGFMAILFHHAYFKQR